MNFDKEFKDLKDEFEKLRKNIDRLEKDIEMAKLIKKEIERDKKISEQNEHQP